MPKNTKKAKSKGLKGLNVYRPGGALISISGDDLEVSIQYGSLVITNSGVLARVFAPTEWATVNQPLLKKRY